MNFSRSSGRQIPVGAPNGDDDDIQLESSKISAPCVVDKIRPNTKKPHFTESYSSNQHQDTDHLWAWILISENQWLNGEKNAISRHMNRALMTSSSRFWLYIRPSTTSCNAISWYFSFALPGQPYHKKTKSDHDYGGANLCLYNGCLEHSVIHLHTHFFTLTCSISLWFLLTGLSTELAFFILEVDHDIMSNAPWSVVFQGRSVI